MTRVKMLVSMSGTFNGQPWPEKGGDIDVPETVANDLIANGYAERVGASKPTTAAVDPVVETAAKPETKARKATTKE